MSSRSSLRDRHLPLSRNRFLGPGAGSSHTQSYRHNLLDNDSHWQTLDRSQVLGNGNDVGHTGCVNALCWRDDGEQLLSGSDDQRLCMWSPDEETPSTPHTPHPFKLHDVISTAHTANIFSAKYLPHASHTTMVSVAGDRQVLVYDVERLERMNNGINLGELNGRDGPGVRKLLCHKKRVKRISTEDNPHVFLTVSEDGTVRQHDLRQTHTCPARFSSSSGSCPSPLLECPPSIELYSLSVSKLNPYLFTVAGTSPYAFLQDRRMVRHMTSEWGHQVDQGAKVQCVRRFGLGPEGDEEGVGEDERARRRRREGIRHITAVEMSADNAEDLLVSFSGHSVGLFSIHDSPQPSSVRASSSTTSPNTRTSPGKRRRTASSPGSPSTSRMGPKRLATETAKPGPRAEDFLVSEDGDSEEVGEEQVESPLIGPVPVWDVEMEDAMQSLEQAEHEGVNDAPTAAVTNTVGSEPSSHGVGEQATLPRMPFPVSPGVHHMGGDMIESETSDGGAAMAALLAGSSDDEDMSDNEEDEDEDGEEDNDGDDYDEGEDEDEDLEAMFEAESRGLYPSGRSELSAWADVPVVFPRRNFKGARNVETVKDVTFLGARSNKVCSGSDDGNWFVWDKNTGRLEGIWEGDGSVVNVVEQHPSLPICAVSGIDSTIKIFAPLHLTPNRSFRRTEQADTIIHSNTTLGDRPSLFGRSHLVQQYAAFLAATGGIATGTVDEDGDDDTVNCRLQ